jgi:hypothetical protein
LAAPDPGDWDPGLHLLEFVNDVVNWADDLGVVLPEDERELLSAATVEARRSLFTALERDFTRLRETDPEAFEAAGFSQAQATFKTQVAREAMKEAIRPARWRRRINWKGTLEGLGTALDAIKEVLSSIESLSKWIEAAGEIVGVLGSGVRLAAEKSGLIAGYLKRRELRRRSKERKEPLTLS